MIPALILTAIVGQYESSTTFTFPDFDLPGSATVDVPQVNVGTVVAAEFDLDIGVRTHLSHTNTGTETSGVTFDMTLTGSFDGAPLLDVSAWASPFVVAPGDTSLEFQIGRAYGGAAHLQIVDPTPGAWEGTGSRSLTFVQSVPVFANDPAFMETNIVWPRGQAGDCEVTLFRRFDFDDLLFVLDSWGTPDGDIDGDGTTGTPDLLILLANWSG